MVVRIGGVDVAGATPPLQGDRSMGGSRGDGVVQIDLFNISGDQGATGILVLFKGVASILGQRNRINHNAKML